MEGVRIAGEGRARHLRLALLEGVAGLAHGFTVQGSDPREAIRAAAGHPLPLATLRQVHGAQVRILEKDGPRFEEEPGRPQGDALLTRREGIAVGVATADCVPILIADPESRWLAAVHAGWRGTAQGVLKEAIAALQEQGAPPARLFAGLGPAIGACCFEVGDEVIEALRRADPGADAFIRKGRPRARVDLIEANRRQALASGVPRDRIAAAGLCTVCERDLLESYRRSGGAPGRMVGFAAWRDASPRS